MFSSAAVDAMLSVPLALGLAARAYRAVMKATAVRFGEFRLDPARRELWRGDDRVPLPSRVFDCIAYLIEHRDRAVGRDELISAVWGKADISDNVLDQTMLRARRTLGDTGDERRMILTKPRFGYGWVAPTEPIEPAITDAPPALSDPDGGVPETAPATTAIRHGWLLPVAMMALAIVVAGAAFIGLRAIGYSSSALARADRALVLPVTADTGPEQAWIRLGVMDLIAERLRATGQPVVPSDNVVALVRGVDLVDPAEIERISTAAAATLVVSVLAQASPDGWRVSLQTVRGRDPALTASGEADDVLAAARIATDVMADRLGLPPAPSAGPPADDAVDGLLQQVEAALLADEMETARALLERFDASQRLRPDVRFRAAMIDFRIGRLDAAQTQLESLLIDVPAERDASFHARIQNAIGNVFLRRGDFAAAEDSSDAVIALLGEAALSSELGRALTGRAIARSSQNRFQPALADFVRARVVLESIGDRLALARVDTNIGILDARRDRFSEARPVLTAAAERLAAFHDLTNELYARVTLAYTHLALLDPAAAMADDARLRELVAREPNAERGRYANLARADVLAASGRMVEARALLESVRSGADAADDAPVFAAALAKIAIDELVQGNAAQALQMAETAVHVDWEDENPREFARAWLTLVRAVQAGGGDAVANAHAMAEWAQSNGTDVADTYAVLAEAIVAGEGDAADAAFDRALAKAEASRVPQDLLAVSEAYAEALIQRGELARAGEVAARTAGWADQDYSAALLQLRLYHALAQPPAWRSALSLAQALAGERAIPPELLIAPTPAEP